MIFRDFANIDRREGDRRKTKGETMLSLKEIYDELRRLDKSNDGTTMAIGLRQLLCRINVDGAPQGLTFDELRDANARRLRVFKTANGEPAHRLPDGSDWKLSAWSNAIAGEVGELCNIVKKLERGDLTESQAFGAMCWELADIVCYSDLFAGQIGAVLGEAVAAKFNVVSDRIGCDVKLPLG